MDVTPDEAAAPLVEDKAAENEDTQVKDVPDESGEGEGVENKALAKSVPTRGSKREGTQNVSYFDTKKVVNCRADAVASEEACGTEKEALEATVAAERGETATNSSWKRRLLGFVVVDSQGETVPLQRLNLEGNEKPFITGEPITCFCFLWRHFVNSMH